MGFWRDFFKVFARQTVQTAVTLSTVKLEEWADKLKLEVDENDDFLAKEKELLKKGIDLLVERAKIEAAKRL